MASVSDLALNAELYNGTYNTIKAPNGSVLSILSNIPDTATVTALPADVTTWASVKVFSGLTFTNTSGSVTAVFDEAAFFKTATSVNVQFWFTDFGNHVKTNIVVTFIKAGLSFYEVVSRLNFNTDVYGPASNSIVVPAGQSATLQVLNVTYYGAADTLVALPVNTSLTTVPTGYAAPVGLDVSVQPVDAHPGHYTVTAAFDEAAYFANTGTQNESITFWLQGENDTRIKTAVRVLFAKEKAVLVKTVTNASITRNVNSQTLWPVMTVNYMTKTLADRENFRVVAVDASGSATEAIAVTVDYVLYSHNAAAYMDGYGVQLLVSPDFATLFASNADKAYQLAYYDARDGEAAPLQILAPEFLIVDQITVQEVNVSVAGAGASQPVDGVYEVTMYPQSDSQIDGVDGVKLVLLATIAVAGGRSSADADYTVGVYEADGPDYTLRQGVSAAVTSSTSNGDSVVSVYYDVSSEPAVTSARDGSVHGFAIVSIFAPNGRSVGLKLKIVSIETPVFAFTYAGTELYDGVNAYALSGKDVTLTVGSITVTNGALSDSVISSTDDAFTVSSAGEVQSVIADPSYTLHNGNADNFQLSESGRLFRPDAEAITFYAYPEVSIALSEAGVSSEADATNRILLTVTNGLGEYTANVTSQQVNSLSLTGGLLNYAADATIADIASITVTRSIVEGTVAEGVYHGSPAVTLPAALAGHSYYAGFQFKASLERDADVIATSSTETLTVYSDAYTIPNAVKAYTTLDSLVDADTIYVTSSSSDAFVVLPASAYIRGGYLSASVSITISETVDSEPVLSPVFVLNSDNDILLATDVPVERLDSDLSITIEYEQGSNTTYLYHVKWYSEPVLAVPSSTLLLSRTRTGDNVNGYVYKNATTDTFTIGDTDNTKVYGSEDGINMIKLFRASIADASTDIVLKEATNAITDATFEWTGFASTNTGYVTMTLASAVELDVTKTYGIHIKATKNEILGNELLVLTSGVIAASPAPTGTPSYLNATIPFIITDRPDISITPSTGDFDPTSTLTNFNAGDVTAVGDAPKLHDYSPYTPDNKGLIQVGSDAFLPAFRAIIHNADTLFAIDSVTTTDNYELSIVSTIASSGDLVHFYGSDGISKGTYRTLTGEDISTGLSAIKAIATTIPSTVSWTDEESDAAKFTLRIVQNVFVDGTWKEVKRTSFDIWLTNAELVTSAQLSRSETTTGSQLPDCTRLYLDNVNAGPTYFAYSLVCRATSTPLGVWYELQTNIASDGAVAEPATLQDINLILSGTNGTLPGWPERDVTTSEDVDFADNSRLLEYVLRIQNLSAFFPTSTTGFGLFASESYTVDRPATTSEQYRDFRLPGSSTVYRISVLDDGTFTGKPYESVGVPVLATITNGVSATSTKELLTFDPTPVL